MQLRLLTVFACQSFLLGLLQADTPSQTSSTPVATQKSTLPPESLPVEWVDPQTKHRVVRLSKEPGSASLYFHQNAYSPEGDKLLITAPSGLTTVDLRTHELKLIVPRGQYRIGGSSGVEMGRRSRHVYYAHRDAEGMVARATNIDTLKTQDLARLPPNATLNGVNADETLLLGTLSSGSRRRRSTTDAAQRQMSFFTVSIDNGDIKTFHTSRYWLNHAQCSPTDPGLALFCHEGLWHEVDRIWTIRMGNDTPRLMHRRQQQYEIAGHEFFSSDGQWVWYDLQTPRAAEFWLAGVNIDTGKRIRYAIKREEWSVHYTQSRDGRLFAGDGGGPNSVANQTPLPAKRRLNPNGNGQWIYLFRPEGEFEQTTISGEPAQSGRLLSERLVDLSGHDYTFEPNATFTPDGQWIVFRSNMHGERHVYKVKVALD